MYNLHNTENFLESNLNMHKSDLSDIQATMFSKYAYQPFLSIYL